MKFELFPEKRKELINRLQGKKKRTPLDTYTKAVIWLTCIYFGLHIIVALLII